MRYLKVACATMAGAWLAGTMLYAGYAGAATALGGGAPAGYEARAKAEEERWHRLRAEQRHQMQRAAAHLGVVSPRNEAPDDYEASFVPMRMIAAEYGLNSKHEPLAWGGIKKGYTHFAEGDVGLAKITPCFENRKSTVFRNLTGGIGSGTTELHVVRPLLTNADYIVLFLKSPHFIESGIARMTGTAGQKRVPSNYFTSSPFPLPPLAEQYRIVAKVQELLALCDRLEISFTTADTTRSYLLDSLLHEALAPAGTA